MKTLKQLADLGAAAASDKSIDARYMAMTTEAAGWSHSENARQAFAQAVKDAVMEDLVTNQISSPTEPVLVPLTMNDIRATDEFKHMESHIVETADHWNCQEVTLSWSGAPSYDVLAAFYLRRQHGSNEWKPCTKEKQ